ncbi:MAG: hypothetical protein WB783_13930 [Arenicellales bacterium]
MDFEELDYRPTPLGELVLRRRTDPRFPGRDIHEIKLGDEFLMSSLFTDGEIALADLALAMLPDGPLDVAVGGLGLGYTAEAVLHHENVRSLVVIEYLEDVIDWHRRRLVPLGGCLTGDLRCRLLQGDFFVLVADPERGLDVKSPGRRFDALLVDIDHSPHHWLDEGNERFYDPAGLRHAAAHLRPGGVFGLWSNDRPDVGFEQSLQSVFAESQTHRVTFHNPYTGGESASTVYVARVGS